MLIEKHHFRLDETLPVQARDAVRLLRVNLHEKELARLLKGLSHLHCVLEKHIVVFEIVMDKQLPWRLPAFCTFTIKKHENIPL
jgi:hypothetical protein